MSSGKNRESNLPSDDMTIAKSMEITTDGLFEEHDKFLVGVFYEDRYIEMLHLFSNSRNIGKKDYHVVYDAYNSNGKKYKTGIVMANPKIKRSDYDELYYPREKTLRHYSLERIANDEGTYYCTPEKQINTPEHEFMSMMGKLLLNDSRAVRREDYYCESSIYPKPLLAGKLIDDEYDDRYNDLIHDFCDDMLEIQQSDPIRLKGYGSFHQIKNLTRDIL